MRLDRRRRRLGSAIAAAVLGAAVGLALWASGLTEDAELATVDTRFDLRGDEGAPAGVVVVGVDAVTLAAFDQRWPFGRAQQARAIRAVAAAQPRVLAYDVEIAEQTVPAADEAMADALAAADVPMVLATTYNDPAAGPGLLFLDDFLAEEGITVGHAGFPDTPGGVIRWVPYEVDGLSSFAVATAAAATGAPVSRDGFGGEGAIIDYAGPPGTVTEVSWSDVVAGRVPPAVLRDKVVIVGTTEQRLKDVAPTPMGGPPMSGPEINANAVATILAGVPLRDATSWVGVLAVLLLSAAGGALALALRPWIALLAALGVAVLYALLAQAAFLGGSVIPVVDPLLGLAVATLAGVALAYALLERERARLRTEFGRFVPAAVVDEVIERAGDAQRLGGRRVFATVLFADLRGFTATAERLPPESVIEVLNRYLTEMSDAILDEGGTLLSYLGDGILAVFGAPIEQPDHADRALAAARGIRGPRLERLNAWCAAEGIGESFALGLGIASGPVMSGNVGSERRLEYTAVGDTVNTASRLQALCKDTGRSLLVSDATRGALTRPAPDLVPVGALELRGRSVPTAVWTLDPSVAPASGG